jgi:hypothetical protein
MKFLVLTAALMCAPLAGAELLSVHTVVKGKQCEHIASNAMEVGHTLIGGNGYRILRYGDSAICYKYDSSLSKSFFATWNPVACRCELNITLTN